MKHKTIIIDIETVPLREDKLSEEELRYILKSADTEEQKEEIKRRMSFWPFTAHLVSLGMLVYEDRISYVMYLANSDSPDEEEIEGIRVKFIPVPIGNEIEKGEKAILQVFWKYVKDAKRVVSFNGRGFDAHFLMLKSMILGVEVSRNLMGNRYDYNNHLDLLDLITFHGVGRHYTLDFICRRLGISTPKMLMNGDNVRRKFEEGKFKDIALYNFYDVLAAARIYERVLKTLGKVLGIV